MHEYEQYWYERTSHPTKRALRRVVAWVWIVLCVTICAVGCVYLIIESPWMILVVVLISAAPPFIGWLCKDDEISG